MPSRLLKDLEPVTQGQVSDLISVMLRHNYPVRTTHTLRTLAEQDALYAQGRTKPGVKVTNAKGGESAHNYGMAADLVFVNTLFTGPWPLFGKEAKKLGLEWGGDWGWDFGHVQRKQWRHHVKKVT
jgi:peptidoglycan L-alanyl-D-glutamate endopeptidase CwlK